ncbi:sensor histidine kinase [Oerskovia sp. KBS0722]|nr:sensor histidine kinase [Oerskovia sp. KBS0722]
MSAVTSPQPPLGDAAPDGEPSPGYTPPTEPVPSFESLSAEPAGDLRHVPDGLDPRYVDLREPVGFLAAPFARQTWREFGYLWLSLFVAPFAFTYVMFTVSFTAGVLVTVVGLVVSGGLVLGARGWGGMYRSMARSMLSVDVLPPTPHTPRRGFWRMLWSNLSDGPGWRAMTFMFVSFFLALVAFVVTVTFFFVSLGAATHWFWSQFLPAQMAADGTWHRGAQMGTDWYVDTPLRQSALAAVGIAMWWLWPQLVRGFAQLFRLLSVNLLGPTRASLRVADLEKSRGKTVEDADAKLRRIERDLHDGTQARLVAVAMQLGEAKEQLAAGGDASEALELVDNAHSSTKEALVELRELARGIHPPALDNGLAVALETLAARSPLPVTVDVDPGITPSPAVETIAYFCVAELVTNAAKHARASGVYVLVEEQGSRLRLRVRDDGQGGARISTPDARGHRSGLAGLEERVRSVDGTLDLVSPVGGPTVVTVVLPSRV